MSFEEFKAEILSLAGSRPKGWRFGQFVFNCVEQNYPGVGRCVQSDDGVDCFYDDSQVDEFLRLAYEVIAKSNIAKEG